MATILTLVNIRAGETVSLVSFRTFAVVAIELGVQWVKEANTNIGVAFKTTHETVDRVNNGDWWLSNNVVLEAIKATDRVITGVV